ncbi:MAG: Uma2 family endonuclease [Synechococcales bacterium]|nr:Uma2 family endonuclease [Synechococcales bacterium]
MNLQSRRLSWQEADPTQLPTMDDLPSEDPQESGLPDEFHGLQPNLLSMTLALTQYSNYQCFHGFDLNIYYEPNRPRWHKRPDWFLVVGGPRLYKGKRSRASYVMWDEKVAPIVILEFLFPGTEADDLGPFADRPKLRKPGQPPRKFQVYEQILQVPNYIVFDEETGRLWFFRLQQGRYQPQAIAPSNPQVWIPELEMGLGIWYGNFQGLTQDWLRWCDRQGHFLPTETEAERAEKERERAEKERERNQREAIEQQMRQAVMNLLQMGLLVEQVAIALSLSPEAVQAIQQDSLDA